MQNAVKEEFLDYTSFISDVKERIEVRMGKGYQVKLYKIMKNNSLELDSLVVLKEGRDIAPNIYLNAYYQSYMAGTTMEEIVDRLCIIYSHCSVPILQDDFEYSLETMRPFIFISLVSLDRNKKLLLQIPHIKFLDLAVTFHCLVRNEDEAIGTIRITKEHMKLWDINLEDIKELAFINTKRLFPPKIRTMEEMVNFILRRDANVYGGDCDFEYSPNESYPMYILTNEKGINGASCMLYKDVIKDFANLIKSDLYILPSSIHELILMPMENTIEKEKFNQMVMEINASQVPEEDILSDHVYIYSRETDTISM